MQPMKPFHVRAKQQRRYDKSYKSQDNRIKARCNGFANGEGGGHKKRTQQHKHMDKEK
jgi:hypothetical protein